MKNPWLEIPLSDYEAHMALPAVAQAALLRDIFAEAVRDHDPRSLLVVGCSGGNGFDCLAASNVERVIGIDINPAYVEAARARYAATVPGLQLLNGDIQKDDFDVEPVDLILAGLIFEYVDISVTLERLRQMLRPGGTLASVVQLPAASLPEVTPSPYPSLAALAPVMRLVDPEGLRNAAEAAGFRETDRHIRAPGTGKQFLVQEFFRPL